MQFLALTEFDHASINPLTDKFWSDFEPLKDKLPLLNSDEKSNYGTLKATLNEYLTWAFALQFFYEHSPDQYPALKNQVFRIMSGRSFTRFEEFMLFYEEYMNNQDKYPILEDYYPTVVKWIGELE